MTTTLLPVPGVIALPDGRLVTFEPLPDDGLLLTLAGTDRHVEFYGIFAQRMARALTGKANPEVRSMLRSLIQPWTAVHPWLTALTDAPRHANAAARPDALILGAGLGMLFIEVTDRCNERCIHCYAEAAPERADRLSLEDIEAVLRAARRLGEPAVQFTGGDPLIHPDIVEAVALARRLGHETVEIYTNGLALTEAMLEALLPHRPRLAFSVYSHDAATHDAITRVPGSHRRTLRAMRSARSAGFAVRAGIIVMPENRGHESDTIRMLQRNIGLDSCDIGLDVVRSAGRGRFMQDHAPDATALEADSAGHRPDDTHAGDSNEEFRRRGKLCVAANGDVHPCIFSRAITLGNIHRAPLDAIVRNLPARLDVRPSAARWNACRRSLSCADCQAIAYALGAGDDTIEHPCAGAEHAAA